MNKKIISALAATAGLFTGAHAQEMIAGWDFSPFAVDQFSSLDGTSLTGTLGANFSSGARADSSGVAAYPDAADYGMLYYDGTFGSTAFSLDDSEISPDGQADLGTLGGNRNIGSSGYINTLVAQGQPYGNPKALGLTTNGAITFGIDLSGFPKFDTGSDWSLAFAAVNDSDPDNSSSIAWDYSLDGSQFVSLGETTAVTNNAAAHEIDLSDIAELDDQSEVFFRASFSGIDGGRTFIDNFQVLNGGISSGGSLFFLDGSLSTDLGGDWYLTPLGEVNVAFNPWMFSMELGWFYSSPENTSEAAYIYILGAPFEKWVYVEQSSATADGFWGYAFDPVDTAVQGWFWFNRPDSVGDIGSFFIYDYEAEEKLTFDDQN